MSKTPNARTLNTNQKNVVRIVLAAGATVATLIGAQTLAFSESASAAQAQNQVANTGSVVDPNGNTALTNNDGSTTLDSGSYQYSDDGQNQNSSGSYQNNSSSQSQIYSAPSQPFPLSRSSRRH
ncbi:MAG TPA: hypothetical protein VMT34_10965 [Aggregatilineales bacterium]|nr:hypothetical protein [Aggregatilineales bacterium]